ncbi:MAG: hypothetical protein AB7F43_11015 [Bacteriovoracia bacterium]
MKWYKGELNFNFESNPYSDQATASDDPEERRALKGVLVRMKQRGQPLVPVNIELNGSRFFVFFYLLRYVLQPGSSFDGWDWHRDGATLQMNIPICLPETLNGGELYFKLRTNCHSTLLHSILPRQAILWRDDLLVHSLGELHYPSTKSNPGIRDVIVVGVKKID